MPAQRRSRRARPIEVEPLESKALLSGVGGAAGLHAPPVIQSVSASATVANQVAFDAKTRGFYTMTSTNPDVGKTYRFQTTGRAQGLGRVIVVGDLHTTGFIANGHAGGSFTVFTSQGSLKLDATGPTQPGFSKLPNQFSFTIEGGTGKFKGATGGGTLTVTLKPDASSLARFGRATLNFQSSTMTTV